LRAHRAFLHPEKEPVYTSKKVGAANVYKLPVVCRDNCNGGWMNRLETRASRLLKPMIRGEAIDLSETDQALLAVWATKTALLYDLIEPQSRIMTPEDLRWFGTHQQPPEGTQILLAAYDDGTPFKELAARFLGVTYHLRRVIKVVRVGAATREDRLDAPVITIGIGYLVVQAVIPTIWPDRPIHHVRPTQPYAFRISPGRGPITWPPAVALDTPALGEFSSIEPPLFPRL
jgi:hypothetical protein